MDFTKFKILSFDCYGTLVDWKKSIIEIVQPVIRDYHIKLPDEELFRLFLEADRKSIQTDYVPYKDVLTNVMIDIGNQLNLNLYPSDKTCLVDRFGDWSPFPDSADALLELMKFYKLAIISNVDDEMFALTKRCIGIQFEHIITAKQVGSYKPSLNNFNMALEKFAVQTDEILHIAQSIHHDIIPTNKLGWSNVWVNRYQEPERTNPDEFPDLEVPDLKSLVKIIKMELSG